MSANNACEILILEINLVLLCCKYKCEDVFYKLDWAEMNPFKLNYRKLYMKKE